MNGLATTNENEQAMFIASQVADFTNDTTLLNKFLEEVSNPKVLLEQNTTDNLALVQIIVKAGVHLLREKLFASSEHELLFASSLRAISNILNETPEILALPIQSGAVDQQDDLWSWLLSQFLQVLKCEITNATFDSVLNTVRTVLSALQSRIQLRTHLCQCLSYLWGHIEVNTACKSSIPDSSSRDTASNALHDVIRQSRVCSIFILYLSQADRLESISLPRTFSSKVYDRIQRSLAFDMPQGTSCSDQAAYMITVLDCITALSRLIRQDRWLNLLDKCLDKINVIFPDKTTNTKMSESIQTLIDIFQTMNFASPRCWSLSSVACKVRLLHRVVSALKLAETNFPLESYFDPQQILSKVDDASVNDIARASAEISSFFKKRKVETTSTHPLLESIIEDVEVEISSKDLSAILQTVSLEFESLQIERQSRILKSIGQAACAAGGTLAEALANADAPFCCKICDYEDFSNNLPELNISGVNLLQFCLELQKLSVFRDNAALRIDLMASMKRIVQHDGTAEGLDLNQFASLKYLNASLTDESRHMRLLTGQVLSLYFRYSKKEAEEKIYSANRRRIFDILRKHSSNSKISESLMSTWALLGRSARPEDMQLILVTLVDALCDRNIFNRQMTVVAIHSLTAHLKCSAYMLFSPFMRHISVQILDRSETQPELMTRFASLLGISIPDFLTRNQQYLLPPMILHGMHKQIASLASGTRRTIKEALLDNMPYLLSYLLTSGYTKDGGIVRFLGAIDIAFSTITLEELINAHPIPLAAELLQLFAEKSLKRETVLAALSQVAHTSVKTISATRKTPRDIAQENLRSFLRKHSLGIISQCEESINGFRGRRGILDRSRYITAIGEMIILLGQDIENAVPQITACLQTAMEEPGLRTAALSAWEGLVCVISEEVAAPLIPYSACLFMSIWMDCTDHERQQIRNVFDNFLDEHQYSLSKQIGMIPRLRHSGMEDIEARLEASYRSTSSLPTRLRQLSHLCISDNPVICYQGLFELKEVLSSREVEVHSIMLRDTKEPAMHDTLRNLLDVTVKFRDLNSPIQTLATDCLGIMGAIDPVLEDATRISSREVIIHNFEDSDAEESVKFVRILLETQLVHAFKSATRSNVQIFLAWAIQELLKFSGFDDNDINGGNEVPVTLHAIEAKKRWKLFSPGAREVMTPLLTSKYDAGQRTSKSAAKYPIVDNAKNYHSWLFLFLHDLLQSAVGENARKLFGVFTRILREEETTISNFLLPYVFLNVCVGCTEAKRGLLHLEIDKILTPRNDLGSFEAEYRRLACETIFSVMDYLSLWLRSKKIWNRDRLAEKMKRQNKHMHPEDEEIKDDSIRTVQAFIAEIPSKLMAEASIACGSNSRALFYWEQHIRSEQESKKKTALELEPLYSQLQQLYIHISDPDGIQGVSTCLSSLTLEQEILMHENAGRWTAAQSSYELALQAAPNRLELKLGLLNCLKETGHHEVLLDQASRYLQSNIDTEPAILDLALESSWSLDRWEETSRLLNLRSAQTYQSLLSEAFCSLRRKDHVSYTDIISQMKVQVTNELVSSNIDSTWQCFEPLAKLAIIHELSTIKLGMSNVRQTILSNPVILRDRLLVMPTTSKWRQHLLAVRRTLLSLLSTDVAARSISSIWLESAKLARKAGQTQQAYKAILNALHLNGTPLATIEHARWWWKEGQQMRAIQTLRKALDSKIFEGYEPHPHDLSLTLDASLQATGKTPKVALISKAELLLTRWNDLAEHTNSKQQLKEYVNASRGSQLEKPHYFMGRYYLRLLEAEAKKSPEVQDHDYMQGEYHRQVVMSYGRAMHFGVKYIFQTLPSYLQLWLDFGNDVRTMPAKIGLKKAELLHLRLSHLANMNEKIKGFVSRLPTYLYMLAFPQILSRINHAEKACYNLLETMILKCLMDYPKQSLWPFMAVCKSRDTARSSRGNSLIARLRAEAKKIGNTNLIRLTQEAQNLTDELMHLCTVPVIKNRASLSLTRDLDFKTNVAPSNLVVPVQNNLTVILPAQGGVGSTKHHRAFEESQPTISSFKDEVDVMSSLQRPRKITIRASDGQNYPFLVKPNDDLRKDARLMDFNGVIQKFIRRDPEAVQRLLQIRTYAVIALNEDHGLCEWVKNTRPLRDILVKTYTGRNIPMAYGEVKTRLEQALASDNPALSFERHVLSMFPPTFHDWFVEKFSNPSQWFSARLSYSRTLAVMSMVGFVLGLGDRHGENILFDETTGDAVHVDFNCLFEKGHTFDKPERVPFRMTHNMTDALGVTGIEGSFRKTCEITLKILRNNQDAFNTVLESFLHDPVNEYLKKIKKSATGEFERAEAIKVLSVIANKLKGSAGAGLNDKHVPLSIEGQADELIRQATDSKLLVQMYIGWTAWL